ANDNIDGTPAGVANDGREGEPTVGNVARDHLLEPGLVDRHPARAEDGDLLPDVVDADNVVAEVREDGPGHEADVPGPDDADVHGTSIIAEVSRRATVPRRPRRPPSGKTRR